MRNPKAGHNHHARFTLIKQLTKTENVSKATLKLPSKNFWILKLDTLSTKGLNKELNNI